MTKDDQLYLRHMLERCRRIAAYIVVGREGFFAAEQVQDAVIRNLEVIGETAKHISIETRGRLGEVDWRRVAGMRDVLIHNYIGVDLDEVWNVVSHDVPALERLLSGYLAPIESGRLRGEGT